MSRRDGPGPGSCAPEISAHRARELRRRAAWSRRWGARTRRPSGSASRARRAARRDDPGRPGPRPLRPAAGGAAQHRRPGRPAGRRDPDRGRARSASGRRGRAWRTCSPCWPSRSGRSAGCCPSCRAVGGRLRAGRGGAHRQGEHAVRRSIRSPSRATARPRSTCAASSFALRAAVRTVLHDVSLRRRRRHDGRPGRVHRRRVSPPIAALPTRLLDPDRRDGQPRRGELARAGTRPATRRRRPRAAADVPLRRHGARQRHPRPGLASTSSVWAALQLAQAERFVRQPRPTAWTP